MREFKARTQPGLGLLKDDAAGYTGKHEDIDRLLHRAWDGVLCKYSACPAPDWDDFVSQFGKYVKKHQMRQAP